MNFVKVISTELDNLQRRVVKVLRFGKSDVQTSDQVAPHGIDSNPIKDMIAVYAKTEQKGETVILGYLNRNVMAGIGETRIFSTNSSGTLQTFIWLKADGTIELGGANDFAVRFNELKSGFDQLKSDHNDLVTAFNAHMHATAGTGPPSPPTPGSGIPATPSTANIDSAKIEEIKTL
jgi:hypothetical protein